jgi:hypothetical protein
LHSVDEHLEGHSSAEAKISENTPTIGLTALEANFSARSCVKEPEAKQFQTAVLFVIEVLALTPEVDLPR